jgi:hypothetical protein
MDQHTAFKWRHFDAEIILLCMRWYTYGTHSAITTSKRRCGSADSRSITPPSKSKTGKYCSLPVSCFEERLLLE